MKLYHGGTEVVENPRIIQTFTGRDFGVGFYMTGIKQQAIKWAVRQARYRRKPDAVLNIYEFDDSKLDQLEVLDFKDYSMEWLEFVVKCRSDVNVVHSYDLIMGKIANDDVGETIQAVLDGLTSLDFALSKLVFMYANNQMCFSTTEALNYLSFIKAEKVN